MKRIILFLGLLYFLPSLSKAYSVLTHEAIIDASWKDAVEPLLKQKFPGSTTDELLNAHAYAYGGSIIPDIGYYPFGSKLFTNLLHNVRTGDFIMTLIKEAQTLNEYAFALGVLSHYMADNYGHSLATNVVVPLIFKRIKSKYGHIVTYADHKKSHSRVEFGFDLLQIARGNYASKAHRDFIGFKISKNILEQAFYKTYGIFMDDVFNNTSLAITSLRWSVKTLFPSVITASLINKAANTNKDAGQVSRDFSFKMKKPNQIYGLKADHQNTRLSTALLSVVLPVLPKIGPLSKLRSKPLTVKAEELFVMSFDSTLNHYTAALRELDYGELKLANRILDTGHDIIAGNYHFTDLNYEKLLLKLKDNNYVSLTSEARTNLIEFYSKWDPSGAGKRKAEKQQRVRAALTMLKSARIKENSAILSLDNR